MNVPHLIFLYDAVMLLRGSARAAWIAVETHRSTQSERSSFAHVGCACVDCAEDARLCEAFREAERAEDASIAAIVEALASAPWGAQPDGSFVTRQSTGIATGRYVHTLHAPGKGGPLVEVQDGNRWGSGAYLRSLRTREEARAIRDAEKVRAREAERTYALTLVAARNHLMSGGCIFYRSGQEGGTVTLASGHVASATGALKACGFSRRRANEILCVLIAPPSRGRKDDSPAVLSLELGVTTLSYWERETSRAEEHGYNGRALRRDQKRRPRKYPWSPTAGARFAPGVPVDDVGRGPVCGCGSGACDAPANHSHGCPLGE